MSEALNQLLQQTGMWRASSAENGIKPGLASEYPELDRHLPGGGWPRDGVTELLLDHRGCGELRLIAPALSRLSREQLRWIAWIAPPHIPYPPALAAYRIDLTRILIVNPTAPGDLLWAAERTLASRSCSAVLVWPGTIGDREIRRLQLAAREGSCWSILFRPGAAARQHSPAELRMQLYPAAPRADNSSLGIKILKRRGGWATEPFPVDLKDGLDRRHGPPAGLILPPATMRRRERSGEHPEPMPEAPGLFTKHRKSAREDGTLQWH